MAKYRYPAVFQKDGSFYFVTFPDLEGCFTQGETIQDAFEMAEDVLCLTLYCLEKDGKNIPAPSDLKTVSVPDDAFTSLVACDTLEYMNYIIE